jgi:hypothetical protein
MRVGRSQGARSRLFLVPGALRSGSSAGIGRDSGPSDTEREIMADRASNRLEVDAWAPRRKL